MILPITGAVAAATASDEYYRSYFESMIIVVASQFHVDRHENSSAAAAADHIFYRHIGAGFLHHFIATILIIVAKLSFCKTLL